MNDGQEFEVCVSFKNQESITATLCKKGVDDLFRSVTTNKTLHSFVCIKGDKALFRTSEVVFVISKLT